MISRDNMEGVKTLAQAWTRPKFIVLRIHVRIMLLKAIRISGNKDLGQKKSHFHSRWKWLTRSLLMRSSLRRPLIHDKVTAEHKNCWECNVQTGSGTDCSGSVLEVISRLQNQATLRNVQISNGQAESPWWWGGEEGKGGFIFSCDISTCSSWAGRQDCRKRCMFPVAPAKKTTQSTGETHCSCWAGVWHIPHCW